MTWIFNVSLRLRKQIFLVFHSLFMSAMIFLHKPAFKSIYLSMSYNDNQAYFNPHG